MRAELTRISTGISGLDTVLGGGYPEGHAILLEGAPGTGKTTMALQFLSKSCRDGARGLFISVAQTRKEIDLIADSHGIDLANVEIVCPDLDVWSGAVSVQTDDALLDILVAQTEEALVEHRPRFFVFDSLLELRLLSANTVAYRRHLLILRRRLQEMEATGLLLDSLDGEMEDRHERGIVHGIIKLEARIPNIGTIRRRLMIPKMRGMVFLEGYHDFRIEHGGLNVYPRLVPTERPADAQRFEPLSPSDPHLEKMLGGGLELGTTALIAGQAGCGKSTMATIFAVGAAGSGVNAALFLFEERPEVFRMRSQALGLGLEPLEASGNLTLNHFDPAESSPGEFSRHVIAAVDGGAKVVVIDSLSGYLNALPDHDNVLTHLHTLLQYLARRRCLVIITLAQSGLLGEPPHTTIEAGYLADSIILLRHYAVGPSIRRSVAVVKKRHSAHERGISELVIMPHRVEVRPFDGSDEEAFIAQEGYSESTPGQSLGARPSGHVPGGDR
ncbi:ATPase domain-containing protein [Profundibacterium mesophilum]|uniref:Recombination protein RecA n=1 Tax=Profundibacterium mesophilum KAUST100406-0324 TaxID=1037889 RepID=A0A921NVK4_9RHOB|nr:ATPase domain-containing protein [Profundibacterium mesophilum]KAF0676106.1 recombination protein RecA [Profundibacterium mesophilum KAUST100406-0324]